MKIFLSWSGSHSKAVAEALNVWLRRVIQAVKPFYSPEIEKGANWSNQLDAALEGTRFGIICLTPDNLDSTWIHYETGALSKTPDALIWTFLCGIDPGDVKQPLGKYQHTIATNKADVLLLLRTINKRLADVGGEPLEDAVLVETFDYNWPKLEEKLKAAAALAEAKPQTVEKAYANPSRDEREILLEILEIVRSQQRSDRPIQSQALDGKTTEIPRRFSRAVFRLSEGPPITMSDLLGLESAINSSTGDIPSELRVKITPANNNELYLIFSNPVDEFDAKKFMSIIDTILDRKVTFVSRSLK